MNRRHTDQVPFRIARPGQVPYTFDRPEGAIDVNDATKADPEQILAARAFKDGLRDGPCTGYQRIALRCELRAQGYPLTEVTPQIQQLFQGAGLAWPAGADLDRALEALCRAEASHLMRQLKGSA